MRNCSSSAFDASPQAQASLSARVLPPGNLNRRPDERRPPSPLTDPQVKLRHRSIFVIALRRHRSGRVRLRVIFHHRRHPVLKRDTWEGTKSTFSVNVGLHLAAALVKCLTASIAWTGKSPWRQYRVSLFKPVPVCCLSDPGRAALVPGCYPLVLCLYFVAWVAHRSFLAPAGAVAELGQGRSDLRGCWLGRISPGAPERRKAVGNKYRSPSNRWPPRHPVTVALAIL